MKYLAFIDFSLDAFSLETNEDVIGDGYNSYD